MHETLLVLAVRAATKLVAMFLELGADLSARDKGGASPLMMAAFRGQVEVIQMLLASKQVRMNSWEINGTRAQQAPSACEQTRRSTRPDVRRRPPDACTHRAGL
jgi:ankyrin repeat protein